MKYLLQLRAVQLPPAQLPRQPLQRRPLPDNYTLYNGYCYIVVKSPVDWYAARDGCTMMGATLASIHDMPENDFIISLATTGGPITSYTQCTWIGAFRPPGPGLPQDNYGNIDGTPFDYHPFGFMDDMVVIDNAIYMCQDPRPGIAAGVWEDARCTDIINQYVCKYLLM